MKILITVEELNDKRSRDLVPLECEICGNTFYKVKSHVMRGIKGTRQITTCSKECSGKMIGKKNKRPIEFITLTCEVCKVKFERKAIQYRKVNLKKNKVCCCSRKCAASWQYSQGLMKNMRSTLEYWIEETLTPLFPDLGIRYNVRDIIDGELDIYIPSLNVAFELNHYKPIYGTEKLEKRQTKDFEKSIDCFSKVIDLHVIDCREFKYLNENVDIKYLNYIVDVIKRKVV
jgi:hypothetical protein